MKKRGRAFTVLELMIALTVLAVVASVAMVGYQGYRDRAAMLVDEMNQKILQAAVKLYAYDTNALPASLSDLRRRDLERAFALLSEGKRPYTFLAYLGEWIGIRTAEAVPLPPRYYNGDPKVLTCPMDRTPPADGGVSYAIHPSWQNQPLSRLLDPAFGSEPLIVESDTHSAAVLTFRHGWGRVSVVTTASGERFRIGRDAMEDFLRSHRRTWNRRDPLDLGPRRGS